MLRRITLIHDENTLKEVIAANISYYRRLNGDTQAKLAEKLSYSDKSVSKWERAEAVPDVFVLVKIADLYNVTVSDLLNEATPHREASDVEALTQKQDAKRHTLVLTLSCGLAMLIATIVFFILSILNVPVPNLWMCFIYALPVMFIVCVVFTAIWFGLYLQCISVSLLIWSLAVSLHLSFMMDGAYLIYLVAGVLQVLCLLWYLLIRVKHVPIEKSK